MMKLERLEVVRVNAQRIDEFTKLDDASEIKESLRGHLPQGVLKSTTTYGGVIVSSNTKTITPKNKVPFTLDIVVIAWFPIETDYTDAEGNEVKITAEEMIVAKTAIANVTYVSMAAGKLFNTATVAPERMKLMAVGYDAIKSWLDEGVCYVSNDAIGAEFGIPPIYRCDSKQGLRVIPLGATNHEDERILSDVTLALATSYADRNLRIMEAVDVRRAAAESVAKGDRQAAFRQATSQIIEAGRAIQSIALKVHSLMTRDCLAFDGFGHRMTNLEELVTRVAAESGRRNMTPAQRLDYDAAYKIAAAGVEAGRSAKTVAEEIKRISTALAESGKATQAVAVNEGTIEVRLRNVELRAAEVRAVMEKEEKIVKAAEQLASIYQKWM